MGSLAEGARELVDDWPAGGLAVGVLPDSSDPEWSGGAVLEVARAAARDRRPALILDLAPEASGVGDRVGAGREPGFAEVAVGAKTMAEVVRWEPSSRTYYLPAGGVRAEHLVRSRALRRLADQVDERDGLLLVLLDPGTARRALTAGWTDGFACLGDAGDPADGLPGGLSDYGHLPRRPRAATGQPGPDAGRLPALRVSKRHWMPRNVAAPPASGAGTDVITPGRWAGDGTPLAAGDGEPRGRVRAPAEDVRSRRRTGRRRRAPAADRPGRFRRRERSRPWLRRAAALLVGLVALGLFAAVASRTVDGMGWGERGEDVATAGGPADDFAGPARGGEGARPPTTPSPPDAGEAGADPGPAGAADDRGSAGDEPAPGAAVERRAAAGGTGAGGHPGGTTAAPAGEGGAPAIASDAVPFVAVSDSLGRAVERYWSRVERYRAGGVGCRPLWRAREEAGRLFMRLSMYRLSLGPPLDSGVRGRLLDRSRQIEAVDRSFWMTDCPRALGG